MGRLDEAEGWCARRRRAANDPTRWRTRCAKRVCARRFKGQGAARFRKQNGICVQEESEVSVCRRAVIRLINSAKHADGRSAALLDGGVTGPSAGAERTTMQIFRCVRML